LFIAKDIKVQGFSGAFITEKLSEMPYNRRMKANPQAQKSDEGESAPIVNEKKTKSEEATGYGLITKGNCKASQGSPGWTNIHSGDCSPLSSSH